MTRYAIDAQVALQLVEEGRSIDPRHTLVGPSLLRSHALAALYRASRDGSIDDKTARTRLEAIAGLKIRLLGDRVSRATAYEIARRLDADDTAAAEYLAVAKLQADALVTDDPVLAAAADGIVRLASYSDLFVS